MLNECWCARASCICSAPVCPGKGAATPWTMVWPNDVCLFANIVLMGVQIKVWPRLRPPPVGLRLAAHPLL